MGVRLRRAEAGGVEGRDVAGDRAVLRAAQDPGRAGVDLRGVLPRGGDDQIRAVVVVDVGELYLFAETVALLRCAGHTTGGLGEREGSTACRPLGPALEEHDAARRVGAADVFPGHPDGEVRVAVAGDVARCQCEAELVPGLVDTGDPGVFCVMVVVRVERPEDEP